MSTRGVTFYVPPNLEEQLISFYKEVNPTKVNTVANVLLSLYIGWKCHTEIQGKGEAVVFQAA